MFLNAFLLVLNACMKLRLSYEAAKDAKYGFGDVLSKWFVAKKGEQPPISNSMEEMVSKYHRDCAQETLKYRKRHISRLFEKIQKKLRHWTVSILMPDQL